jgi:hypothetical protein
MVDYVMITLAIAGILLLISSAWMLNNFDRLAKAFDKNPDCPKACNVDTESVTSGRTYAIFTLGVSIIIFICTSVLLYGQFTGKPLFTREAPKLLKI